MAKTKKGAAKKVVKKEAKKPEKKSVAGELPRSIAGNRVVFEVTAIIPTQQYGNIQPKINVIVDSIEEGRALVMPHIEDLYRIYAETPLNGREPKFVGKVTETVKEVATAPAPKAEEVASSDTSTAGPVSTTSSNTTTDAPKSEAVMKAEKAIGLAMTVEATQSIQDQIEKSTKIAASDKPKLYELVLKKRKELNSK